MGLLSFVGLCYLIYLTVHSLLSLAADSDLYLFFIEKFSKKLHYFHNKVVWITGASSGIGEALAIELSKHGAKLVLSARNSIQLERVKNLCVQNGAHPQFVITLPMDVTQTKHHKRYFDQVVQQFGGLDILINNAGRSQRANWEEIELEVDREMFELNVFSVLNLSRIAVKHFLNVEHGGHLVVTSSIAGLIGAPYSGSYTGSKHAIHGYFDSLRREKQETKKLTVTLLCPGPTLTNFLKESFTAQPGVKFNQSASVQDKRMSAERCAYLSAVAIANRLDEAWLGKFPILPMTYIGRYCPNITRILSRYVTNERLQKLRDSRNTVSDSSAQNRPPPPTFGGVKVTAVKK
uniref:Dehydrogenase/reductase SDR family member 7 n=1 Tax=Cacopsylla melanoneura TaxID=428564 RepID=A0A8D8V4N0_9HEMI